MSNLKDRISAFRRPEDYAKYAESLRIADLPAWADRPFCSAK